MSAYCDNCKRYVNQYCDSCGENFGTVVCEKYACGGTMVCPICGGGSLKGKKEFGPDPFDPRAGPPTPAAPTICRKCNYELKAEWKFCPMCASGLR